MADTPYLAGRYDPPPPSVFAHRWPRAVQLPVEAEVDPSVLEQYDPPPPRLGAFDLPEGFEPVEEP